MYTDRPYIESSKSSLLAYINNATSHSTHLQSFTFLLCRIPENFETNITMESLSFQDSYPQTFHFIAVFLFFLESYHIIGHSAILFRLRMLPRKDLVRIKYYFLLDTLTVFTVSFLYTQQLRWLAALQMCQHLFFFFTWNKNKYTRKVSHCYVKVTQHAA